MRISSLQIYSKSASEMLDKQAATSEIQSHIASGKRMSSPSDDPLGATKAILLNEEITRSVSYQKNCNYAKNYLEQQDNVLKATTNIVQRISELAIQAGNGGLSDTDRYSITEEISSRKKELLDLSNTKDPNGNFFFSGFKSNVSAVKINGTGDCIYQGDDGQRLLNLGRSTEAPANLSGKDIFFNIPNSNIVTKIENGNAIISATNSGLVNSSMLPNLSNIDLSINKYFISASLPDGVSTTDSSASAISFSTAINLRQPEHESWASALPNQVDLGVYTSGAISVNQFSINQIAIIDPIGTEFSLLNAINLKTEETGVVASQPGGAGTAILLNAQDGRNIQITSDGSSLASFGNFDISGGTNLDKAQRAGVMLRSNAAIQIGGANPECVGLAAENYPISTNLGTGSMQANVISPISDLTSSYSIVFGAGGTTFSLYDDKSPSQAISGFNGLSYTPDQKIIFQDFELKISGIPQAGDVFSLRSEQPAYQDIFKTIDNLIYAMNAFGKDPIRLSYEIGVGLSNLDSTQNNFLRAQSIVGANLNIVESQVDIQSDFQLMSRAVLSQIEDLDYAKAISDLTQATFTLEAAQKSFVHIQSLSIFNYLRA